MRDTTLSRRRFLQWTGASAFATMATQLSLEDLAHAASVNPLAAGTPILVVITLYGGNDGLNTVVPYTDATYHSVRSNIALTSSQVLPITSTLALNASMPEFAALYNQNKVAIVQGVGYPQPNLSHFTSMAIWQTASMDASTTSGWLGRWLDTQPHGALNAIGIGSVLPPLLVGARSVASMLPLGGMKTPAGIGATLLAGLGTSWSSDVHLEAVASTSINDLFSTAQALGPLLTSSPTGSYLNQQLSLISTLISANVPTRVWEVNLSSFDTHVGEQAAQNALLAEVSAAIGNFMKNIGATTRANDVTILMYSEFGRRVGSNAGLGTDHGAAAPVFVIGNSVKGGLYGAAPALNLLDPSGNLIMTTDFRDVYGGILHDVLETPVGDVIDSWNTTLSVH